MNPGALGAFATAHKKELLVGGAGVAVVGGLYARSKSTAAGAAASVINPGTTAPMPSASGTGYDSSASDVYNAIQPQIETTQTQLGQTQTMVQALMDQLKLTPVPAPAPATPKPAPATAKPAPVPVKVVPVKVAPKAAPPKRVTPAKVPAKPAPRVYVVKAGDNLSSIAARLGIAGGSSTGWHTLYNANRAVIGGNANLIHPGQRLVY